jgi:hypothetical protein
LDQNILHAINDPSIALKQQAAGVLDKERAERANAARDCLRAFLTRLARVVDADRAERNLGVDRRFKRLADDFRTAASQDFARGTLLRPRGPRRLLELLESTEPESGKEFLDSLAALRRLVSRHQQADSAAILKEF